MLITGHYDHFGIGTAVDGDSIYNGAEDNASGTAAILNLDVMNLYGRTQDVSALGLDQSSLGAVFRRAAAAEGLQVSINKDALLHGSYFRSDHFPFARAGVPGTSIQNGEKYVGRPSGYGHEKKSEYTRQALPPAVR